MSGALRSAIVLLSCAGVLGAAATLAIASPVSAHNYLVSSEPAIDAVVTAQPGTFSVTTNDNLLDLGGDGQGSAMQIVGPSAEPRYYGDGCTSVVGPTVSMDAQLGAAGEYTVIWKVVSTDGHPVSGEYAFTWQPTEGVALSEGTASPPDCGGRASGSGAAVTAAPASDDGSSEEAGAALGDIAWIGGALGAVAVAGVATALVLRRRQG